MKDFTAVIADVVSSYGFPVKLVNQKVKRYQRIDHDMITRFHLKLRFWGEGRVQVEVYGRSVKSSRNVDYYDNDNSVRNLKSRLKRLVDNGYSELAQDQSCADQARSWKAKLNSEIQEFNNTRPYNHSVVVDQDELVDDYKVLSCYYRSYELSPRLDEDGMIVFKETLFNKSIELTLTQVVSLIDALEV